MNVPIFYIKYSYILAKIFIKTFKKTTKGVNFIILRDHTVIIYRDRSVY